MSASSVCSSCSTGAVDELKVQQVVHDGDGDGVKGSIGYFWEWKAGRAAQTLNPQRHTKYSGYMSEFLLETLKI